MSTQSYPHNYVSVLLLQFAQPLADLYAAMTRRTTPGPNDVQASCMENGNSVAIIVLAVLMLESASNRVKYLRQEASRETCRELLARLGAGALADDVEELFVLRDIIAHNHVWAADVDFKTMRVRTAKLLPGYGDSKFRSVVDLTTRKTRRLNLDIFPTRIHKSTAVAVLKKLAEAMSFLESIDINYLHFAPHTISINESNVPFYTWIADL